MTATDEHHRALLRRLLGPAEAEVGCDECFDRLDEYVDLQLTGADADAAVPGMHAHLAGCPACAEEHQSLLELSSRPPQAPHAANPPTSAP